VNRPRTVPEMLDAATTDDEFASVVLGMFRTLETMIDKDEQADA
jgi:hypothetical protein